MTAAQLSQLITAVVTVIGAAWAGWKSMQANRKVDAHTAQHAETDNQVKAPDPFYAPKEPAGRYSDDTTPAKEGP